MNEEERKGGGWTERRGREAEEGRRQVGEAEKKKGDRRRTWKELLEGSGRKAEHRK